MWLTTALLTTGLPLIYASQLASSNGESVCDEQALWFSQAIDHFGGHNGTFRQKFYMSSEHYKPGGPILLFQGEESLSLDCISSTIMYDFAQELNGIVVNLEHRYFGESVPFGLNLSKYSPNQWRYLTLDNVMQDAVTFVESIRRNVTGASKAPVLAASGSYGGFLMAMFRQNHPETFRGVIASAPVLRAFYGGNETDTPGQYNWWNYTSRVYRERSAVAATKIHEAFNTLVQRFARNNVSSLQNELNLCAPVTSNSTATLAALSSSLQQVFSYATEFNYAVARPGRSSIAYPLEKFTNIAIEEKDPLQILNRTNQLWNSANAAAANFSYTCFNESNVTQLQQLAAPLISVIPFDYVLCTYVQFGISSVENGTIFLPSQTSPATLNPYIERACLEKYGVEAPSATQLYEKYHFTDAELRKSTGIILSLAQYDPTTSVSGKELFDEPVSANGYASRKIITSRMAHREDLFAQDSSTKPEVRRTNQIELETFREWISLET